MTTAEVLPTAGAVSRIHDQPLVARIIAAVEKGATARECGAAGPVSKATVMGWQARGKAERARLERLGLSEPQASEAPYLDFLDRLEAARGKARTAAAQALLGLGLGQDVEETTAVEIIEGEGDQAKVVSRRITVKRTHVQSVQALVEYLKRSNPEEWSEHLVHTGADGGAIEVVDITEQRARANAMVDELEARRQRKMIGSGELSPAEVDAAQAIAEAAAMPMMGPW